PHGRRPPLGRARRRSRSPRCAGRSPAQGTRTAGCGGSVGGVRTFGSVTDTVRFGPYRRGPSASTVAEVGHGGPLQGRGCHRSARSGGSLRTVTTEAFIYEAIRTPRGRAKKTGSLHSVKPISLVTGLIDELRVRFPDLDENRISDLILGVVGPVGDQGADIART